MRWQGNGHKQRYRLIDFKRKKHDMPATVERLNTTRTAPPSSRFSSTRTASSYILAPQRLAAGDSVAGDKVDVKPGNAMKLAAMPVGTIVHNIEMKRQGRPDRALCRPAQYPAATPATLSAPQLR